MIHGLTEKENVFLLDNLSNPLKEKGAEVYLFGSRATGTHKKFSDIDILYVPDSNNSIPMHVVYLLLSKIEESDFSYKIDLVNASELQGKCG